VATLFLDSGVFVQGISAEWGAAKAILILGARGVFSIHTSEVVIHEVTAALNRKGMPTGSGSDFERLVRALKLTVHPRPSKDAVREGIRSYLPLVRHRAGIPIVVAALAANPDWLVSSNTEHFNPALARAMGLRIVSPPLLLRHLQIGEGPRAP
jgi:predicted nucleic acid-binding protein